MAAASAYSGSFFLLLDNDFDLFCKDGRVGYSTLFPLTDGKSMVCLFCLVVCFGFEPRLAGHVV